MGGFDLTARLILGKPPKSGHGGVKACAAPAAGPKRNAGALDSDTLNRADGLIQLHKYPPRFLQQQLASLGQPYSTDGPLEQPYPKYLFQLLYLVAQRRLRG
jgi:hypothetical protein